MEKNYIKMNDNKNYLSLGNIFNLIKLVAKSKSTAMQLEIFASIFNINNVNKTTVNNYCTGYRAISIPYKQIFIDLKNEFINDYNVFIPMLISILRILDEEIYLQNENSLELINNNIRLKKLCQKLYSLALTDLQVNELFLKKINKLYENNNLYECFINYLSYAILDNTQPKYIQKITIDISKEELIDYLKIKLYEGVSYINSLKELAKKNNMYANAELGSLEFSGLITGTTDYKKCCDYYYQAALKDHPKGCWMVANLILTERVDGDFDTAWHYLNHSIDLGSVAGLNTMGNCYLIGNTPSKKKNSNKALEYYKKASDYGYVYAFNNLGKFYEQKDKEKALYYYKLSADLKESWALNKVGEYYRKQGDLKTAYIYYNEAINSPISERNYYAYYNLAKYYYLVGNKELKIKKDVNKALEYLQIANENGVKEAEDILKEYS